MGSLCTKRQQSNYFTTVSAAIAAAIAAQEARDFWIELSSSAPTQEWEAFVDAIKKLKMSPEGGVGLILDNCGLVDSDTTWLVRLLVEVTNLTEFSFGNKYSGSGKRNEFSKS